MGWLFCWLGEGIAFGSPVAEGVGAAVDIRVHGEVVVVQSVEDGCAKDNINHGRKKWRFGCCFIFSVVFSTLSELRLHSKKNKNHNLFKNGTEKSKACDLLSGDGGTIANRGPYLLVN